MHPGAEDALEVDGLFADLFFLAASATELCSASRSDRYHLLVRESPRSRRLLPGEEATFPETTAERPTLVTRVAMHSTATVRLRGRCNQLMIIKIQLRSGGLLMCCAEQVPATGEQVGNRDSLIATALTRVAWGYRRLLERPDYRFALSRLSHFRRLILYAISDTFAAGKR